MNFLKTIGNENSGPIQKETSYWISVYPHLEKYFQNSKFVKPLLRIAEVCIHKNEDKVKLAHDFVTGLVYLRLGMIKNDEKILDESDHLMKPCMDLILGYIRSNSFQKALISRSVTGQERLPIQVPEIYITTEELLAFQNRIGAKSLIDKDVSILKQQLLTDKIESWGLSNEEKGKFDGMLKIYHPHIFNENGWLLWDYLMKDQKRTGRGVISDINFFYHKMKLDKFIHAEEVPFMKWICQYYPGFPDLERFHNLKRVDNPIRRERYSIALAHIKSYRM